MDIRLYILYIHISFQYFNLIFKLYSLRPIISGSFIFYTVTRKNCVKWWNSLKLTNFSIQKYFLSQNKPLLMRRLKKGIPTIYNGTKEVIIFNVTEVKEVILFILQFFNLRKISEICVSFDMNLQLNSSIYIYIK